jgi:hypothetical protein
MTRDAIYQVRFGQRRFECSDFNDQRTAHAVAFVLWVILFIAQVSLVTTGRVSLHGRLGVFGLLVAVVVVVLGIVTASDSLARQMAQPATDTVEGVRAFYAVPVRAMLMFSAFVYLGYRNRFQPAVHKRLMWFATLVLLEAGFDRWPNFDRYSLPVVNLVSFAPLLLLLIGYDWWSTGKVQRVTIWCAIFLVLAQQISYQLSPRSHCCLAEFRVLGRNAHAFVSLTNCFLSDGVASTY